MKRDAKRLLHRWKTKRALQEIGVQVSAAPPLAIDLHSQSARRARYSPHEAALLVAYQLPEWTRTSLRKGKVQEWARKGKINPADPLTSYALKQLGCDRARFQVV